MKATILLRLLIPFCGFVIANAKDEDTKKKISIPKAITEIKSKVHYLEDIGYEQFMQVHTVLVYLNATSRNLLLSKLTAELDKIRIAVNTTKEEGKEAENCFQAATKYADEILKAAEFKHVECIKVSLNNFIKSFGILSKIRAEANGIIDHLSTILFVCNGRRFDKRHCVVLWTKESTDRVNRFNQMVNWYSNRRAIIFKQVARVTISWIRKSFCESAKKIAKMQLDAKTCIERANINL